MQQSHHALSSQSAPSILSATSFATPTIRIKGSSNTARASKTITTTTTSNKRTRDTVVVKPILYGNYSQSLNKKSDENKTHKWTCYVRGLNANEDLSYISKVVFELHESFANPIREVIEPPWEVSEEGWGEFEIRIKIFFRDTSEKPIQLFHLLALYPRSEQNFGKKIIVEENYEELIFVNPKYSFYQLLLSTFASKQQQYNGNDTNEEERPRKHSAFALSVQSLVEENAPKMDEKRDLNLLLRACKALDMRINELNQLLANTLEHRSLGNF
jgi:YEATS domain-containing protein 4